MKYGFAKDIKELKLCSESACFASYYNYYVEDTDYFVKYTELIDSFPVFVESFNSTFKNSEIIILEDGLVQLKCSDKYNELARYIVMYMLGVITNYFNDYEGYRYAEIAISVEEFVNSVNKSKRTHDYNSNHYIYSYTGSELLLEDLLALDNIEFMNKYLGVDFKEKGEWALNDVKYKTRLYQTAMINRIKKGLKGELDEG